MNAGERSEKTHRNQMYAHTGDNVEQGNISCNATTQSKVKDVVLAILSVAVFVLLISLVTVMVTKEIERPNPNVESSLAWCGPTCPRDWIGYGDMCYLFSEKNRNWTSSQNYCNSQNASLATAEITKESFLKYFRNDNFYWIFKEWPSGENSVLRGNKDGDCVYIDNEAKISSSQCRTKLRCICCKPATCPSPHCQP